jgi:hypothetical protein
MFRASPCACDPDSFAVSDPDRLHDPEEAVAERQLVRGRNLPVLDFLVGEMRGELYYLVRFRLGVKILLPCLLRYSSTHV